MEWVTITHPTLPGQTSRVARRAFDLVWAPAGWVLVDGEVPTLDAEHEQDATEPVADEEE